MSLETITDAEWEIMRIVWTKGETTSTEIFELLQEKINWKPSTVKTLLNRLVEKNYLQTEKSGKRFLYTALVAENKATSDLATEVEGKICAMKIPDFLAQLLEDSQFTKEDLAHFEEIINNKKKTTVEKIACNCLPGNCHC
ncbi:CopY/TcrY family copper transport repressor [Enterococcus timonensis]|uniref:CopY/TcrY family copper transport repressor n=1 Tax=Enterococcus timonensis TaxID=1852364 RepID=UPI0008DA1756|nr:CopY/TcrY family copper transport repressor [Enterococcus timonensis]